MKQSPLDQRKQEIAQLQKEIHIKGACTNNLKNVELRLPKNKLIVVTGLSGSGKSSLVIDTLYAEGQRRYVESMSSYARQFLGRMKKPEVDFIKGISPAIAIEQKVSSSNARSTVGSLTELYDYLRLLYARVGQTISPVSGEVVKKHQVSDVIDALVAHDHGTKIQLLIPLKAYDPTRTVQKELELLLQKGFTRLCLSDQIISIEDYLSENEEIMDQPILEHAASIQILIDRFVINDDPENIKRIGDSVNTAFYEGHGECILDIIGKEKIGFNNRFEIDGITFLEPSPQLFNYNNPYGACKKCEGYGQVLGIDPDKVIPDQLKSVYEGAVACWKGEKNGMWNDQLIYNAESFDFPVHTPYNKLTKVQKGLLWKGNQFFEGINQFFKELEDKSYKIQNRVTLARFRGRTVCPECDGGRLREEASYVKIDNCSISELIHLPIGDLKNFFEHINLNDFQQQVSKRILIEIESRLKVMCDIGLSYLTLDRTAATLSGGETQRISLTRTLGSNLTSSLYILDEPSIGLHPKDTAKLVSVLKALRDLGNTVVVVEHEEEVIKSADHLVDVGPLAGIYGGEIVYEGPVDGLANIERSLTMQYLQGLKKVEIPKIRRKKVNQIVIKNASQHNLKGIDVIIPLSALTVITGVSGSGKTSLVKHILYPALLKELGISDPSKIGLHECISGDIKRIQGVEMINQNPIGRSSRSNPVTYVKAYDEIRKLMMSQQLAKVRGYKPKHFSFNTEGGRCENCKGDGFITIEMQFLADVNLICEDCKGQRFKPEILEIKYNGLNIFEILGLSISESLQFFADERRIIQKIQPLEDVGLGYVKLGQASSTLSGGEAQRVKLASFLCREDSLKNQFFIFDEPTTGLHFDDINKLMGAFQALVEQGHTVVIVEHNLDVIKSADWVIDLGPDGGDAGGNLVFEGTPEGLMDTKDSYTGQFLKEKVQWENAH
jgi:excinuclease ABC subunit A